MIIRAAANDAILHTLMGHTAEISCDAFSPDGQRLATASSDRTIKLWDTSSGREVFTLLGHTAGVRKLAFSPDGHRIASGGIDDTARVWDATPLDDRALRRDDDRYRRKQEMLAQLKDEAGDAIRGEILARKGRWGPAAAAFGTLVEREPYDLMVRRPQLLALVAAGDPGGYRRAVADLLARFGSMGSQTDVNTVAWGCTLAAGAVADPDATVRQIERVLAEDPSGPRPGTLQVLGAALYRAGRFEEAIRSSQESIRSRGDGGLPQSWAYLAMAHHRLGHRDEALRWLEKLRAFRPSETPGIDWKAVEIDILRREAEAVLRSDPASPSEPSARD